ncbi:hypothetical protein [Arthrobacter sp. SDTb3-6]|uniref:hypothetical protein n=1 Tax=Arthrobacter sp. SDTb3-6 TaxID=2713571 RepID=UPI00159E7247|nr:hypothetical protein [Arthrobacter sp. SDTb3-6]NVM97096.1 hypothetical protein [Arthrobacter sp. SDTb3-6]
MDEDFSWPLTVALHMRDALKLPATQPFFIPPLEPAVPEHVPARGPGLDLVLAEEWANWFSALLVYPADIPGNAPIEYLPLEGCSPAFDRLVRGCYGDARAYANTFKEEYFRRFIRTMKEQGPLETYLVRSIEKELGHRAAPFKLGVRILPAQGFWLHRTGPAEVLVSDGVRKDPGQLRRLLGPIIRELAQ